jgi:hypothetical protein
MGSDEQANSNKRDMGRHQAKEVSEKTGEHCGVTHLFAELLVTGVELRDELGHVSDDDGDDEDGELRAVGRGRQQGLELRTSLRSFQATQNSQ